MTALRGLFERRSSLNNPTVPLTADSLLDFVAGVANQDTGVVVSEQTSMQVSAVWRAVSVTANVSASLPLHVFTAGTKTKVANPLLDDPHPELTPLELWRLARVHKLLWGNGYLQKIRNGAGQVVELWPVSPWRVRPGRARPITANPSGKVFECVDDAGVSHAFTTREILHLPGLGYDGVCGLSPIRHAAVGIGLALAAEKSGARFFARGAQLSGVLQVEQRLEEEQANALQRRWEAKMGGVDNSGRIAVLDSNAKFQPITMPMRDAQFLETRGFQVPEIARMFGVPLFLMFETAKSTSWGTGLEQQAQGWITFDLHPAELAPFEQRIRKELLPKGQEARYNVNGLLRGDSAARAAFYTVMRQVGAFSANDIRDKEDLTPIPGGDTYLQPLNMGPLGADPTDKPAVQKPADPAGNPADDEDDEEGEPDDD